MKRRIRLGMVGGGQGAFIGEVHRIAARLDDRFELVAGALSASADKALRSGEALGLAKDRTYCSFADMAHSESQRADGVDAVAVVTPNHLHFPAATAFLSAGIHVLCDKPLTTNSADALQLVKQVEQTGLVFGLTHNYTGYPLVRHARHLVETGTLGSIRQVQMRYAQDWLSTALEESGQKQAAWRTDPAQAGPGGCLGDIGTHAYHLASFVTGLSVESLCAELTAFVPGRALDDDCQVLLRYRGGARGTLWASQIACGNENGLTLEVYGDKGGLRWAQENPNRLSLTIQGQPEQIITRAGLTTSPTAARVSRLPAGHPEGYLEAFATLYSDAAELIEAQREQRSPDPEALLLPSVQEGLQAVQFIEAAVRSSEANGAWTPMPNEPSLS